MSESGKTKAEMFAEAAQAKAATYDSRVRELVEKWMAEIRAIAAERISHLYLVPTLYHDLLAHADFAVTDIASVRKLGFAGAPMHDALLLRLQAAFRPELFVNHYGSSEIYTVAINQDAVAKPGSAGREIRHHGL